MFSFKNLKTNKQFLSRSYVSQPGHCFYKWSPHLIHCRTVALCDKSQHNEARGEAAFFLTSEQLKAALQKAIKSEDYDLAYKLKKEISIREQQDPVKLLQQQLQLAVEDERYQDAVLLRDQLNKKQSVDESSPCLRCSSNTITDGIRITVDTAYSSVLSNPQTQRFLFMYRIRIINSCDVSILVENRKFDFTDSTGFTTRVEGQGIGGQQPILHPGQEFKFTGMYPLQSAKGVLTGELGFKLFQGEQKFMSASIGELQLDSDVFYWPEDIVFIPYQ